MKSRIITTIAILFLIAFNISAQQWVAPVESTLSNQRVSAIEETTDGYIWIGTHHGLNRYNGLSYTVFYQGDSLSLSNDRIWALCPDTGNRLWVATGSGINLIQDSKVVRRDSTAFNVISSIVNLDSENLLYGSSKGLCIYNKATGEGKVLNSDMKYPTLILRAYNGKTIETGQASSADYCILDENFETIRKGTLGNANECHGIAQTPDGSIFFATDKGLFAFTQDFEPINSWKEKLNKACGEQNPNVIFLREDKFDNNLVLGTADGEIYCLSTNTGEITRGWYNLSLNNVKEAICLITQDNMWLSTDTKPLMQDIRRSNIRITEIKEMAANDIVSWLEYYSDNLLLVFSYRKIFLLNTDTGAYRDVTPLDAENNNFWIGRRLLDSTGNLWIMINNHAVIQYRLSDNRFKKLNEWPLNSISSGIWENRNGSISYLDGKHIYTITDGIRTERPLSRGESGQWRIFSTGKDNHQYFLYGNRIFIGISS